MKKNRLLKHRETKKRKKKKIKPSSINEENEKKIDHHPVYGDIPIIKIKETGFDGKTYYISKHDPDYRPALPPKAIYADIRKQRYCPFCNTPKYFYLDEEKKCIQCGRNFIFSAQEQKYWYESLQFVLYSTAIRCKNCRKQKRTKKILNRQIQAALEHIKKEPGNILYLLQYIEYTIKYFEMTGEGDLEKAIGFCRKALGIYPPVLECIFWEAECLRFLNLKNNAIKKYREFYTVSASIGKYTKYRKKIENNNWLQ